jgi:hypothetical protein
MVHLPSQPIPPMEDHQMQLDAIPETLEEELQRENYVLKEEQKLLQQKYNVVLDKNRKWNSKDEQSERTMAAQKAEIARLETRNMRTRQELAEAVRDVARLNTRNTELEELHRKYEDEIHAAGTRFDDYVQDIIQLAARLRGRPPNLTTSGEQGAFRSGAVTHSGAENLQATTANALQLVARTEHRPLSPLDQRPEWQTRISERISRPRIKKEDQNQAQDLTLTSATTTVISPIAALPLRLTPTFPGRLQSEQRQSTSTSAMGGRESSRRNSKMPEETCRKRAASPIGARDSSVEERRNNKHPRQNANSTHKAADPRLQFRRA